ncbi:arylamine N-acetyltransferase [Baekduia soli]|uniref:Arylamine N-acetyltransferase n=1 Tax=Baekduia soli TaxID=496014 RepID=A0A5B8U0N8_9ACTN|nr:arylamine N-acetyltransferase [Baekduia soli]QEC46551.1 arylamine N-acetyltransferase [Baekduia soli]
MPDPRPLLAHLGLTHRPAADAEGLRAVHRAYVSRVPYEALAVQLGEAGPLDPEALAARILSGRGGYCFEVNTVLHDLLTALGFAVQRRAAIVGDRGAHARGEPVNHLALVVTAAGGEYLADAGWGEGPLDPVPLRPGAFRVGPLAWEVAREDGGWWVGQHRWGSSPGFRFADGALDLAAFAPHHERLSARPDSPFVRTLVVQRPHADRIVTLRARTRTVRGPGHDERAVLAGPQDFTAALRDDFGIPAAALGPRRLARLWALACAQHEAHAGG